MRRYPPGDIAGLLSCVSPVAIVLWDWQRKVHDRYKNNVRIMRQQLRVIRHLC